MRAYLLVALLVLLFTSSVQPSPTQEAIEVIEGILVGAFGDIGHEVKDCIKDGQEIFADIEEAVKDFKSGSKADIIHGLTKIGEAIALLPQEIQDCEAVADLVKDFEKIAEEFSNPEELIIHIGEEILWHGVSIYHDVTDCVASFDSGNYEHAGEDIGDIIYILFLKLGDPVIDAKDFLEGFFKGALEDDSVDINECITDAADVIEELEQIISDIKNGGISDPEKLFLDFIDLITESVKSVAECEKAPAEIDLMLEWVTKLKDMSAMETILFKAFLFYPDRLKEDFKDAIDSFEDHTYNTSGFCLGDVLHVFFVDVTEMIPSLNEDYFDDAVKFLHGFYFKAFNIDLKLDTCEADVEDEWALIQKIIDELEHMSIENIKKAVQDLMKAVPEFIQAFDVCKELSPELEAGLEQLAIFAENPTKLPWAITKACTLHFIRVEGDCSKIYHGVHDTPHNFESAGQGSGDLTELLISELKVAQEESNLVKEIL